MGCLPPHSETGSLSARVILDITDKRHPSKNMFSKLKWVTLKERIDYRKCTLVSEVHGRNTRSTANCYLYVLLGRHKEVYSQSVIIIITNTSIGC